MTKKRRFLQRLQEAFASSDTTYIAEQVTDDVRWTIIGDRTIDGKEAFVAALKEMEVDAPMELSVGHIITNGDTASVDGTIRMPDHIGGGKAYAFCDVYELRGSENPKIKEMTSYVIEIGACHAPHLPRRFVAGCA